MRNHLSARLIVLYLALALSVSFTAGFKACTPAEKKDAIAWAKDIHGALISSRSLIVKLKPGLASTLDKIIASSGDLITAIEASNNTEALRLLADIIPLFESIAAQFTDNVRVLTALALVDIGLHFLVNHLPPLPPAASDNDPVNSVTRFKDKQTWGCAYKPEKCKGM